MKKIVGLLGVAVALGLVGVALTGPEPSSTVDVAAACRHTVADNAGYGLTPVGFNLRCETPLRQQTLAMGQ